MRLFLCSALAVLLFTQFTTAPEVAKDKDLETLVKWLEGDFDDKAQSIRDTLNAEPESNYMVRHLARIWKNQYPGEYWLYVEQGNVKVPRSPSWQLAYKVERDSVSGELQIQRFYFQQPQFIIGAYRNVSLFDEKYHSEYLRPMKGCTIFFKKEGDSFVGTTRGQTCPCVHKSLRSDYVTTEMTISKKRHLINERGWLNDGSVKWGKSKTSPLEFEKH